MLIDIQKRYEDYSGDWNRSVLWALIAFPIVSLLAFTFIYFQRRSRAKQMSVHSSQANTIYYQTQQSGQYQYGQNMGGVSGGYSTHRPVYDYTNEETLPAYSPPAGPPIVKTNEIRYE